VSEPEQMPIDRPLLRVQDVRAHSRYEARLGADPELAALLDYRPSETWIALLHTEVQPGFQGQGIASQLARWVFDDARSRGLKILPKCPFIVRWLERHPEQHDVLLRPLGSSPPPNAESPLEPA